MGALLTMTPRTGDTAEASRKTANGSMTHPAARGKVIRLCMCSGGGHLRRAYRWTGYCRPCWRALDRGYRLAQLTGERGPGAR